MSGGPDTSRGRFITFEGGEGAGKSTQVRLLAEALAREGRAVVPTREPGGSTGAEAIRALLVTGDPDRWDRETEALLHTAARRDHVTKTIWPAMERGAWVVCDRFTDSTLAYQGYGHGLPLSFIRALTVLAMGDFRPDLTVVLDLPVSVGLARAGQRTGGTSLAEDRYERMGEAFHHRLRQGFLELAEADPGRYAVIDATAAPEAVHRAVLDIVGKRLTGHRPDLGS